MTSKRLLILGAGGQIGHTLAALCRTRDIATRALMRHECDITAPESVEAAVNGCGFVVNAAAYTAVDKAESDVDTAHATNAIAPGVIAEACARQGVPLLHISTDYVFGDGIGRPWREDDPIAPPNVYGATKAAGEDAVRAACPSHLILRTSWVYDNQGKNFVLTMLRLGAEREELRVVADQHGGPTSAGDIAHAILRMIEVSNQMGFGQWGTYHFSGGPPTTWFDFAAAIFAGRDKPKLIPISTTEYPTPAKRPLYSVLDCGKISTAFGIAQPDWHQSLSKVLHSVAG